VKYALHPEALEEYLGAVAYYADINLRLAESFINAFESGIEEILTYPVKSALDSCPQLSQDLNSGSCSGRLPGAVRNDEIA
jgi:hypothetical protein